jgi:excisionase family DNA binding protein
MSTLSLREAAEQAGVSKSTVFRAITSGRMSAPRDDDGNFKIDPAELFRVYPPKSETKSEQRVAAERSGDGSAGQDASAHASDRETLVRLATAEAQIAGLKDMVEELKRTRDKWEAQAERLTLALAKPEPVIVAPAPASEKPAEPARGGITFVAPSWWPFRRTA